MMELGITEMELSWEVDLVLNNLAEVHNNKNNFSHQQVHSVVERKLRHLIN